jgi:nucleoid-associated protein YgaU
MTVLAEEEEPHYSEFVLSLLDNQYMLENRRLIGLAENAYTDGKYDDAVKYAQDAIKYAKMSDDYVSLQMKIKEALNAIAAAQARLDSVKKTNAHKKYAAIYEKAEQTFTEAQDFRSKEEWDPAKESALAVIAILAEIPDGPVLAAQYRVKTWRSARDCLWNIAAKKEIYGDPLKWRVIYNANKHKLRRPGNPNIIYPGLVLDIPSIAGEYRTGILEE